MCLLAFSVISIYDLFKHTFYSKYPLLLLAWLGLVQLSNVQFEDHKRMQLKSQAFTIVQAIDQFESNYGCLTDSLAQVQLLQDVQNFAKEDVHCYVRDDSKTIYHLSYDIHDDWHYEVYDSETKK